MIQISATNFNSNRRSFSSAISQISANAGACLVEEQKWAFPKPPFHHFAIKSLVLFSSKSANISFVFASLTMVQTGIFKTSSSPFAP